MIDFNKSLVTRTGAEVQIYFVHEKGDFPVHGAYKNDTGTWATAAWTMDGHHYLLNHYLDIKGPEKKKFSIQGYLNIYPEPKPIFHLTRDKADEAALGSSRIACIPIKVEGIAGDGL